jgi:hypothetical protein
MADSKHPSWLEVEPTDDPRIVRLVIGPSTFVPPPKLSSEAAVSYVLAAMRGGPAERVAHAFQSLEDGSGTAYRKILEEATTCDLVSEAFRSALFSNWNVRSFHHREKVADDGLIIRALRRVLPPYSGGSLVLYRGERGSELKAGRIGINWSTKRSVGEMFASGLCRCDGDEGVLLMATAPPSAIIAGPNYENAKSVEEMEHIVESGILDGIAELERFPPLRD